MQKTTARDFDFEKYEPSFWALQAWWMAPLAVFVLTVVLTVLSFPVLSVGNTIRSFPPFAYAFAAPAIYWAMTRPAFKKFALVVLGAQAVSWIIILSWLHNVTWVGMFLLGAFVGAWIGVWHLALWWTARQIHQKPLLVRVAGMFGLAGLWVVIEWTRTWFLTGFPWLPLSASQWTVPALLQIAACTGQKGISFVLITFNFGFAAYWHRLFNEQHTGLRKRSPEFVIAVMVLLLAVMPFLPDLWRHNTLRSEDLPRYARVALVQPDIPQSVKWNPDYASLSIDVLGKLTMASTKAAPEIIIWPEAATPVALKGWPDSPAMLKWVEDLAARAKTPLLIGAVSAHDAKDPDNTLFNEAFVIDPERGGLQPGSYQKRRLVPFGEYMPLRSVLGWLDKVTDAPGGDTQAGASATPLFVKTRNNTVAAGMLICYEDIFPNLGIANMYAGAEMQVVLTNNAWFGEGGAAYQHATHSVMGAVETRRPIVRCGNNGWSGWIDEYGNIRGVMTSDGTPQGTIYFRGTQTFDITRDPDWAGRDSFYVRHGDWFVLVSAALAFFGYAMAQFYKPRDHTPPTYAEIVPQ